MKWKVKFTKTALKNLKRLPPNIQQRVLALVGEIEITGPIQNEWFNFGNLKKNLYHCHLKKGRPTYVAVWQVINKEIRIVEIRYVGTHEKAPY